MFNTWTNAFLPQAVNALREVASINSEEEKQEPERKTLIFEVSPLRLPLIILPNYYMVYTCKQNVHIVQKWKKTSLFFSFLFISPVSTVNG